MEKAQIIATKIIPENRNHSYYSSESRIFISSELYKEDWEDKPQLQL